MFLPLGYYAFSGIFNFITTLGLSIFVLVKNPKSHVNRKCAVFFLSVTVWSFFYFVWLMTPAKEPAEFYMRTCMIPVLYMPSLIIHFIDSFLRRQRPKGFYLANYLLGTLFALTAYSPLYATGVSRHLVFPYWLIPGPVFHLAITHFAIIVCYSFYLLYRAFREAQGIVRHQILYVYTGTLVGFISGSTNYFCWYRVPIPPFLNIFVSLYVFLIAYGIVRYRLMDITVAVTRTGILIGVYALVLIVPVALATVFRSSLIALLGPRWWLVPQGVFATLALAGPFAYLFFQRKAEARLLREQRHYQATLLNAAKGMTQVRDLQHLLSLIVHILTRSMKLTHAGAFMEDGRSGQYVLQASRHRDVLVKGLTLDQDDPLITWLKQERVSVVCEEIRQMVNGTVSPASIEATLKRIGASVVVPSFAEDALIGFLVLGDKKTRRMYSQDDLNVLQTLANQAALAIQNAQFYEELQRKTAELLHTSKLTAMGKMASGMSHQINNRLACLALEASSVLELILPKLRSPSLSETERLALVATLEQRLQSIGEETLKGKTIVKTLLEFSKPTTDLVFVSLQEIVNGGLKMVGLQQDLQKLTLSLDVPPGHPFVKVNVSQLQDVFFNLVDNACDAIRMKSTHLTRGALQLPQAELPYHGTIAIRAKPSEDRTKFLITVADNGLGMKPEDQEKLFLPFHTTKGTVEKGTGLGLFIIREILKGHGGDIRLEQSTFGQGATFALTLPLPEEERQWVQ
jgi:signal transduction histidine kinase